MNNNNQTLVSFIVTCYEIPSDMIKECINSIISLSLSKNEREIILVDDGSKNNPLTAFNELNDEITYVRQKNSGLSIARNTGLRMSTGKFIQFVDGDDYLITETYDMCLDIVRYNEPDVVMFDSTNNKKVKKNRSVPKAIDGACFMRNNNLCASACGYIFNRRILGDLKFTPGIFHEDEEFTPQLILRAEKVYCLDITAYFYRKRQGSITNNMIKRNIVKRLNDVEKIIIHLNYLADIMPAGDKQALTRKVSQLTMDYLYNTVMLTNSAKQIETRIKRLEEKGLFPLPDKKYTPKYTIFRLVSKNKQLRKLFEIILK